MKEWLKAVLRYMGTHPIRPVPEPTDAQLKALAYLHARQVSANSNGEKQ